MSIESDLGELRNRLREARDIGAAAAVLHWDQTTFMPSGGAPGRARQLAVLSRLAHEERHRPGNRPAAGPSGAVRRVPAAGA